MTACKKNRPGRGAATNGSFGPIVPDRPVDRVLSALKQATGHAPRRNGTGWTARCPAHKDKNPSLSVSEGGDERALVRCHAGCSAEAIVTALGMRMSDLMPPNPAGPVRARQRPNGHTRATRPRTAKQPTRTYSTPDEAIAALERNLGTRTACWEYIDQAGDPVMAIARWDPPGRGKTFRPVSLVDGAWIIGDPPGPLPLFGLPVIREASEILIAEGELCCDILASIGIDAATTSAHGSKSASKTDWTPLAGKQVTTPPASGTPAT